MTRTCFLTHFNEFSHELVQIECSFVVAFLPEEELASRPNSKYQSKRKTLLIPAKKAKPNKAMCKEGHLRAIGGILHHSTLTTCVGARMKPQERVQLFHLYFSLNVP